MKNESDNIDLYEVFEELLKSIKLIFITTLIASVVVIFYSLSLSNIYTSSSLLTINEQDEKSSSVLNQYSGLASMAGISLPQNSADAKAYRAIATIRSKDFLKILIEMDPSILPSIMAAKKYDLNSNKLTYDENSYDLLKDAWVREVDIPYSQKPTYIEAHEHYLGMIETEVDQISRYIKISVTHISPIFAQYLLEKIIETTNEISRVNDLSESENALNFLAEEDSKTSIISIKRSISSLIDTQLKTKMLAKISDDYLLKIIDSPHIPLKKSAPNRAVICIIGFFIGLFLSCIFVITRFYLFKKK